MKNILFFILLLIGFDSVFGQLTQKIIVQKGTLLDNVIRPDLLYYFSDFKDGQVFYRVKPAVYGKFNYNMLHDEIQFLNENGKKLAISDYSDVAYVLIDNHIFIHFNSGIYEAIESGKKSLIIKRKCNIKEIGKVVSPTFVSHGSNIDQETNIVVNGTPKTINTKREVLVKIDTIPFLYFEKKIYLANDLNKFKKIFKKSVEIDQYINSVPVDFNQIDDLKKLTTFCNSL